ncbi:EF-hand domain-containing protein [Roseovarius autotrophicus]|uniref:EF-hand domain-containing protein n=1 Tax=Roseovarius autotrophicus TaxID=2824121 RepID=UPI001A00079D|nr:EF-hand domain-containing protein [Roseovarius autotrophicus]MBE0453726.1 EF-hand domain-containing protein [Roseovarius sp.]
MNRTLTLTLTSLSMALGLGVGALAADFDTLDADGDGYVSMAEFQEALPGVSVDAFLNADKNADGALSEEEVSAAQAEGILPPSEG